MRISMTGGDVTVEFVGTTIGERCVVSLLSRATGSTEVRRTELPGDADITVEEGAAADLRHEPGTASVVLPMHVHMVVDLPSDPADVDRLFPRKERARVRHHVREHGYEYRISEDEAEFLWFYDHMYAPTMAARHGDRAMRASREEALDRVFRNGNLLLLTANGNPVGGSANVLVRPRGQVMARLLGVLEGDEVHLRRGVTKTLSHRLLEWACQAGFRTVDLQGCEPFPRVGTFRSKALLGAGVVEAPGLTGFRLRLTARRDTPAVREFLASNPMVVFDEQDRLGAVYFASNGLPQDLVHVRHGLSFIQTIQLDDFLS